MEAASDYDRYYCQNQCCPEEAYECNDWDPDRKISQLLTIVLDDDQSNGEVDDDEAKYLYDQIKGDGQIDDIEKALLENIKARSKNFPALLAELL